MLKSVKVRNFSSGGQNKLLLDSDVAGVQKSVTEPHCSKTKVFNKKKKSNKEWDQQK